MRIVIFLMLFVQFLNAQAYISSSKNYLTSFNEATEEYELIKEFDEYNFFKINKAVTMIEHTSSELRCSYMIEKLNKNETEWTFIVSSNAGNKYMIILDFENQNVRIIFKDDKFYMLQYDIQKMWFED